MALFNKRKRDVEPIVAISVVVLLLASGAVVSASFLSGYTDDDDLSVAPGRTVNVYYTGSLYGWYDDEGAIIFDTNVKEHAENDDYVKIGGFSKSSYTKLSFVQGKGTVLSLFEEGVSGHKPGDVVRFKIPLGEGYKSESTERDDSFEMPRVEYMTTTDFRAFYDDYVVKEGSAPVTIKTVYGWDATAYYDSTVGMIKIIHTPEKDEKYDMVSNEKNVGGSVSLSVTAVGDTITCEYVVNVDSGVEDYMFWVKTHNDRFYIHGVESDKILTTVNPAAEEDIYFVVTIISVTE